MDNKYIISLGPDCWIAGTLNNLKIRKESFPFDFLLTDTNKGLEYVSKLIQTNFSDFTSDLEYNYNSKVISKYYPYAQFYHHDLLQNKQKLVKSLKIDHENMEESLIEKFQKRSKRFMNIITNENNKCIFAYKILLYDITNLHIQLNEFYNTMQIYSKCKFILILLIKVNALNDNIFNEFHEKYGNKIHILILNGVNDLENEKKFFECIEQMKFKINNL
jgi:hypothetical protein